MYLRMAATAVLLPLLIVFVVAVVLLFADANTLLMWTETMLTPIVKLVGLTWLYFAVHANLVEGHVNGHWYQSALSALALLPLSIIFLLVLPISNSLLFGIAVVYWFAIYAAPLTWERFQ